ncbi:glycoside hydrolase family 20 zincin-like fold domain-containing protein [Novosphingobium sp. M1R2S20]|uniref:Glycoside hydrolase family 20 zincin-like fold domain-containing protein n=1 Tax=Novosphingobium rhizovicinum TaxID=3228928 RepID=A0ABV3REJ7_9SPHN
MKVLDLRAWLVALACAWLVAMPAFADPVVIRFDRADEQARYAAARLSSTLRSQGHRVVARPEGEGDFTVSLAVTPGALKREAFRVAAYKRAIAVSGGDGAGLIYGALSLAEQIGNGTALDRLSSAEEAPALPFRAIKFNLPWDSYRSSSALDLHYETVRDTRYWEAFLDMMVQNRFNALTLWNLHPFPYMIRAKNFPEASRFSDAELAEWRKLYKAIFHMAKVRGIETYVVNWNVLVSPEFAKAHKLKGNNFWPNYKGTGETSELVKRYTRESVTQVLNEYPDLTGLGFTLAEQMGGMTPQERQAWIDETFIAGMRAAKRPAKMIFRAPLSSDLGQGGSTSVETERLTRRAIEGLDDFPDPVWLEIKFNWSHAHSSTTLVKTHGGPLNDAYFDPPPANYKVAWMARNEDFYALRWGVPGFIREHIRKNANAAYVGGYFVGSENYIPAKDYFTVDGADVSWRYAFERQWLFYKLWGRLLYAPDTSDDLFRQDFVRRYGEQARPLLDAYALASSTQLHFATATDFTWDFTLYGEGMMVLGRNGLEPQSVDRLIQQKPLLANWLSVKDYVALLRMGATAQTGQVTPLDLANRLEDENARALQLVQAIDASDDTSLMYEVADVKTWANLGLYYAAKLRGAVDLEMYRQSGDPAKKAAAIAHLQRSLTHWDTVAAITRPIYKDMPLAHYNPPDNQRTDDNLFHWALLRPAIARDITLAQQASYVPDP